jgi:hypothetical protein
LDADFEVRKQSQGDGEDHETVTEFKLGLVGRWLSKVPWHHHQDFAGLLVPLREEILLDCEADNRHNEIINCSTLLLAFFLDVSQ